MVHKDMLICVHLSSNTVKMSLKIEQHSDSTYVQNQNRKLAMNMFPVLLLVALLETVSAFKWFTHRHSHHKFGEKFGHVLKGKFDQTRFIIRKISKLLSWNSVT